MNRRKEKQLEELLNQRRLYNESTKEELWKNTKIDGNALYLSSFVGGCGIASAIVPSVFHDVPTLVISYLLVLVVGAVFGIIIGSFSFFLAHLSGPKWPILQKIVVFSLVPAILLFIFF